MNRFALEKRRILLSDPFARFWPASLVLLAMLLTACNASSDEGQNPGVVVVQATSTEVPPTLAPADTSTPEATATATATLLPEEAWELPLEWVEPLYLAVKEIEPEASIVTADCVTYEQDVCVIAGDFCPGCDAEELQEAAIEILPIEDWMPEDFLAMVTSVEAAAFGDEYYAALLEGPSPISDGLFYTPEEVETLHCMKGGNVFPDGVGAWRMRTETASYLRLTLGMWDSAGIERSQADCQNQ